MPKIDRMRNMGPFYTDYVYYSINHAKNFWKVAFMSLTVLKFKLNSDLKDVKFDVQ